MAKAIKFDLEVVEKYYRIEEDGRVWSYHLGAYKKLIRNRCNYWFVNLSKGIYATIGVHRLVAWKYIGPCPAGMEVNHIDGNGLNNHWTNLEYVTHSENIRKSYENGRIPPSLGIKRGPLSDETKRKMAERKKKKIVADTGEVWDSIEDCAAALGTYRKAIYNGIKFNKKRNGLRLQFVTP